MTHTLSLTADSQSGSQPSWPPVSFHVLRLALFSPQSHAVDGWYQQSLSRQARHLAILVQTDAPYPLKKKKNPAAVYYIPMQTGTLATVRQKTAGPQSCHVRAKGLKLQ